MSLTIQQQQFADEYLKNGGNGRDAYKKAYPACKKDETADSAASRLLSNVKVSAYIEERRQNVAKKTEITVEKIVNHLAKEVFGPELGDVVEIDNGGSLQFKPGADLSGIDSISHTTGKIDSISVKRRDKSKSLDMLMKILKIGPYGQDAGDNSKVFETHGERILNFAEKLKGRE
jgi:phage terminase small subunit